MDVENILAYLSKIGFCFSGFLKQVGFFIRLFTLRTSENFDRVSSLSSQLKFLRNIIFSHCDDSESISLFISLI